jgi:hypothetical protein
VNIVISAGKADAAIPVSAFAERPYETCITAIVKNDV